MKPSTAIRIISLDDSTDRRAEISRQADSFDLPWSFFSAHKAIVAPLIYKERAAKRHFGRALSSAEIGCYTSHFKCWEWLVTSEYDQVLILEDDVLFDGRVLKKLSECNLADYGIHFLRLFTTHPVDWKIVKFRFLSPHYHLVRTTGVVFGMQGYILTKEAARTLVANYADISVPVDWVLTRYWEHKLVNYCLFPFPVIERFVPSTIGDERHATTKSVPLDRVIWLFWRARHKFMRLYCDYWKAEKWPLGRTRDTGTAFLDK